MSKETGGYAFPVDTEAPANGRNGMSLRDYFAGQLLSSVMGAPMKTQPNPDDVAKACYLVADAMLKARAA